MSFKFGDVLANGYASENNPYYKSVFLRKSNKCIHVMEFDGKLSEFYSNDHKLTKVGTIINEQEMKNFKEEAKRKMTKYK